MASCDAPLCGNRVITIKQLGHALARRRSCGLSRIMVLWSPVTLHDFQPFAEQAGPAQACRSASAPDNPPRGRREKRRRGIEAVQSVFAKRICIQPLDQLPLHRTAERIEFCRQFAGLAQHHLEQAAFHISQAFKRRPGGDGEGFCKRAANDCEARFAASLFASRHRADFAKRFCTKRRILGRRIEQTALSTVPPIADAVDARPRMPCCRGTNSRLARKVWCRRGRSIAAT